MLKPKNIFLFLSFSFVLCRQTKAQSQFSGWLASFNTVGLNKKFSVHFDGQLRSTDKLEQMGTILLRPGLNFHPNKTWTLTAGYALVLGRRNLNGLSSLLPEHRIWQQALLNHKVKRVTVAHRFRFEERFLPIAKIEANELQKDGHTEAYRFRYFLRSIFPLAGGKAFSKGPFLALQDEVFLNTGDRSNVNGKTFDQNRLYGAVGYRKGKMDFEAGYMNQYTVTRTAFTNNHILQLAVYKRL